MNGDFSHLKQLESESIYIIREAISEAKNPVMLYSMGKDSSVMLHLAMKAFYPNKLPFPLMHIDTTWKFKEMINFREKMVRDHDLNLIVHTNQEGIASGITPFSHGSKVYTDVMKTEGLKQGLNKHKFDLIFGGARRDEEKSRSKERVFSFRDKNHSWNPRNQRAELWNTYNCNINPDESIRVFPLSNWTELDIWLYIHLEDIAVVPLYFAKERAVVERDGGKILVDDDRLPLMDGKSAKLEKVRFRTLGCYPLSGAINSEALTVTDIIQEMVLSQLSERQGRVIDFDQASSMEKKKNDGYF